jgi:hypothetical protein
LAGILGDALGIDLEMPIARRGEEPPAIPVSANQRLVA